TLPIRRRSWTHKQRYAAYLFVAPSLLFLLVFVVYPIVGALYFSFHRYSLLEAPVWRGVENYVDLLDDKRFLKAIGNTFSFALMTVPVGTACSLLLALAVNRAMRGVMFFRAAYYMPVVTSFVAVSFICALQMFVQAWILTQGGPLDSTLTVVYLIYSNGFEYLKMGYAAAMSMVLFGIIAIVTYVNTRVIRYDTYY